MLKPFRLHQAMAASAMALVLPTMSAHAQTLDAPSASESPVYRLHTRSPSPTSFPRQYTLVAETNHGDIEMRREFRDIFRNFIKDGGTDIVIESDAVYQEIFDNVKSGQAKLKDFSDVMDASGYLPKDQDKEAQAIFQDIMQLALDHNIRFHAIDHTPQANKDYPDIAEAILTALRDNHPEMFDEKLKDPVFRERFEKYDAAFKAERDAVNLDVAHMIQALGSKAKVLVLYGADHIAPIAKDLGLPNVQGIFLTSPSSDQDRLYGKLPLAQFPDSRTKPVLPGPPLSAYSPNP